MTQTTDDKPKAAPDDGESQAALDDDESQAAPDGAAATATNADRPNPTTKSSGEQDARRQQVLTQKVASSAKSIADAIVIKDDEPFFLCPPDGQIPLDDHHGFGLYLHDTRFLAGYEMRIAGTNPTSLAASAAAGTWLSLELTNEDLRIGNRQIDKESLAVRWTRKLDGRRVRLTDTIAVQSHEPDELRIPIRFAFNGGFEDVMAIRGLLGEQPGTCHKARWDGDRLVFQYDGKDGVIRRLKIAFDPPPAKRDGHECEITLKVAAHSAQQVQVTLEPSEELKPGAAPVEHRTSSGPRRQASSASAPGAGHESGDWVGDRDWDAAVQTDSIALATVLGRSLDDLKLLRGELDGQRYYSAGIPWFSTLFGRDALISAYQTLAFNRDVAADTLRLLGHRQGRKVDDWRDEAPGKILHELRIGELARLDEIPQTPYYGTIDATPLFLVLLARHAQWTGSLDVFHELKPEVERALGWIAETEQRHEAGYLAYDSKTKRGLVNQGWKDSGNGIVDADGQIAKPPIALCEVQGYVYAAKLGIAGLYERDGDVATAGRLRREASELQARFERDFWSDDLGCYVLALHGKGLRERCEVATSNAGQVLWSGLPTDDHARAVSERLLRDDMFNGWGIRTLSSHAAAYWPIGYHLGTVWPHDNSLIASGFGRYGLGDAAQQVFESIVETALDYPHQRLPECLSGYARAEFGVPVRYPVACHPQAWAAGSVPLFLTQSLGLEPDGFGRCLRVVNPRLPKFVERVEIRGLRVADATAHLRFERVGDHVDAEVVRVEGDLDVAIESEVP